METETGGNGASGYDSATIAHLWEHPSLCIAIFGVQFHTPDGQQRYGASGIPQEMDAALEQAKAVGFLHQERLMAENSGVLLQYWRSYEDLDRWARLLPHMAWWRWLLDNAGPASPSITRSTRPGPPRRSMSGAAGRSALP